jgi:hypothetical protein
MFDRLLSQQFMLPFRKDSDLFDYRLINFLLSEIQVSLSMRLHFIDFIFPVDRSWIVERVVESQGRHSC